MFLDSLTKTFGYHNKEGTQLQKAHLKTHSTSDTIPRSPNFIRHKMIDNCFTAEEAEGQLVAPMNKLTVFTNDYQSPTSVLQGKIPISRTSSIGTGLDSLPSLSSVCDGGDLLLKVVTFNLETRVQNNSRDESLMGQVSLFHGLSVPQISLSDYLERIKKYVHASPQVYVVALEYLDRIEKCGRAFVPTTLNVHRLIITAVLLAVKYHEDVYFDNSYFARVGGVPLRELNALEVLFLSQLKFRMALDVENFSLLEQQIAFEVFEKPSCTTEHLELKKKLIENGFEALNLISRCHDVHF